MKLNMFVTLIYRHRRSIHFKAPITGENMYYKTIKNTNNDNNCKVRKTQFKVQQMFTLMWLS